EVFPGLPARADLVAVGGQAGVLEEGLVVAHAHAADVGAQAEDLPVGSLAHLPLPGQEVLLQVGRAVLGEVDEVVALAEEELLDDALFDGDDVTRAAARRDVLLQLGNVVGVEVGDVVLFDDDVRVLFHVLLEELVVAEDAEGVDGEGDLAVPGGVTVAAAGGGAEERHDSQRRSGRLPVPTIKSSHVCDPSLKVECLGSRPVWSPALGALPREWPTPLGSVNPRSCLRNTTVT